MIKKWRKVKTLESYQCGKWYKVDKDKVATPGGVITDYYVIRKNPSIVIIPVDKDNKIYLTKQHRYTIGKITLEFPAGHASGNSQRDILSSAKKELEEECGLRSNDWLYLGYFKEALGIANIDAHAYLARSVYFVKNHRFDPLDKNLHETITCEPKKLNRLIASGKIVDSITLCAYAIAKSKGVLK